MQNYLNSVTSLFNYYKQLGEKSIDQVNDQQINEIISADSNSISLLVKHMSGNMLSRFTDFLTSDGEKPWRNRDAEFEGSFNNKEELLKAWSKGWDCLFEALSNVDFNHLNQIVCIRNEGHTVMEALNRQLAHYAYHTGQIVFLSKALQDKGWKSLSIPKGGSDDFNKTKFSVDKQRRHFTE